MVVLAADAADADAVGDATAADAAVAGVGDAMLQIMLDPARAQQQLAQSSSLKLSLLSRVQRLR